MKTIFTRTQTLRITVAIGTLLLVAGWLILKPEPAPRSSPTETALQRQRQAESEEVKQASGLRADTAGTEMGPPQAYAMVTPYKQQLIGVTAGVVKERLLETILRAVGRVEYDERRIAHVNLRISGWVEDLFVDYTGQLVRKGQPLFTLYSPDLVATQDEFLLALRNRDKLQESPISEAKEQAEQLLESTRARLRLWTLTDRQIDKLARRGKPETYITIHSPIEGYVIEKEVFKGMFVEPETRKHSDSYQPWNSARSSGERCAGLRLLPNRVPRSRRGLV